MSYLKRVIIATLACFIVRGAIDLYCWHYYKHTLAFGIDFLIGVLIFLIVFMSLPEEQK